MAVPNPSISKQFRFTSDYPIDKVIYRTSGSQSIPHAATSSDSVLITIPHGLGFRPLARGVYSDDGFASYFEVGNDPWFYNATFASWTQRIAVQVASDATNIYLTVLNWDTTRTVSWKLIGLAPTDIPIGAVARPVTGDGGFFFDTDYNYLKLLKDDKQTISVPSFGSASVSYSHVLGYRPLFMTWTEFGGKTYQAGTETTVGVTAVVSNPYVTDTQYLCPVVSNSGSSTSVTVHYKVYLDS